MKILAVVLERVTVWVCLQEIYMYVWSHDADSIMFSNMIVQKSWFLKHFVQIVVILTGISFRCIKPLS